MIWLALACSGDPSPTDDTATVLTPTAETGAAPTSETGTAPAGPSCALSEHPLRVRCVGDGPGTVTLSAPGAPDRSAEGESEWLVWALKPETTYTWSLAGATGEVTTGAVEIPDVVTEVSGTPWGFDAVVQSLSCGGTSYGVAIDGDGDIVWYEEIPVPVLVGYDWSPADKSFLGLTGDTLYEVAWDGSRPLTLTLGVDFHDPIHHDAHRWGRYTYLLQAESARGSDGQDYVVDAVEVFDGATPVARFSLADLYDPATIPTQGLPGFWGELFPDHVDWSHGNSVEVDASGELVLSLRWLDSALGIDGDPLSPTFGQRRWLATGSDLALPDPDYRGTFEGQHHVSRVGDQLLMFDNRIATTSRALRLDLAAPSAPMDAEWVLDWPCQIQGSTYPLEGGGVLTTCATRAEVKAFAEGATEPGWTMKTTCNVLSQALRGIPIRY